MWFPVNHLTFQLPASKWLYRLSTICLAYCGKGNILSIFIYLFVHSNSWVNFLAPSIIFVLNLFETVLRSGRSCVSQCWHSVETDANFEKILDRYTNLTVICVVFQLCFLHAIEPPYCTAANTFFLPNCLHSSWPSFAAWKVVWFSGIFVSVVLLMERYKRRKVTSAKKENWNNSIAILSNANNGLYCTFLCCCIHMCNNFLWKFLEKKSPVLHVELMRCFIVYLKWTIDKMAKLHVMSF